MGNQVRALAGVLLLCCACPKDGSHDGGGGGQGGGAAGGGTAMGGGGGSAGGGATGGGLGGGAAGGGAGGGATGGGAGGAGGGTVGRLDGGWCEQAGAWVHDDGGYHQVPGLNVLGGDLSWLSIPEGFCAHFFGKVGNARQLRFAPGGELFVASPTTATTGGGTQGRAQIVVLTDDDDDGLADVQQLIWRGSLPSTQGLLFFDGGFWFQDGTKVMEEPYAAGDRAPTGVPTQVADITVYVDLLHWPRTLDVADDGTIYVSNGGSQSEACDPSRPFHGGLLALDPSVMGGARQVAKGLRNPIDVKCHRDGHDLCFATELALDYSASAGGREKLIPIRDGDDWGFPCCASQNLPYTDVCLTCSSQTEGLDASTPACSSTNRCSPNCSAIVAEPESFVIGDTPFGFDFVDDQFPPPWDHHAIVSTHGAAGTWVGARVVAVQVDPATGEPLFGTNLPGLDAGTMVNFLTGWDDGKNDHGRPSDVVMGPDGRLFIANDNTGDIFWLAPLGL